MPCKKYYGSPRWSGEITDCSMPMTFDTYNLCTYRCLYCFAFFQRHAYEAYTANEVHHVNVQRIKDIFLLKKETQFSDYIRDRKVFQWGGMSEPFDLVDKELGITLELLKFFREINYPISFSTKSVWMLKDDRYREVLKGMENWHFKVSIITLDEHKAKLIEDNVPSPKERLWAIGQLRQLGIKHVTLRLRPFIIGVSSCDSDALITEAWKAGADSVSTEFFCLEARANAELKKKYQTLSQICGYDIWDFYRRNSFQSGYRRLNSEIKKPFILSMQAIAHNLGMRFYVSDAHHKDKCDSGSCCGLPESMNYSRGQWTEALLIAKNKGSVSWDDIKQNVEYLKKFQWRIAEGFNTGNHLKSGARHSQSMYDVIQELWNRPNECNSPYKYFDGVLVPDGKTDTGNLIYKYVEKP